MPFHMWTPDAYEGAPTIVTGFMSTAVKAAAFAAFVRVFLSAFEPLRAEWTPVLWVHRGLHDDRSGTVVGVAQTQPQAHARLFEHRARRVPAGGAGHRGDDVGKARSCSTSLVYAITNLGAFGVLALLGTRDAPHEQLDDFAGLWHTTPGHGGAARRSSCCRSAGSRRRPASSPSGTCSARPSAPASYSLAIVGVLTSVVSVFFYLRIVVMMYMAEKRDAASPPRVPSQALAALSLSAAVLFYLGVLPTRFLELAARSVAGMFWGRSKKHRRKKQEGRSQPVEMASHARCPPGFWLLATGYWLLATGYRLEAGREQTRQ